MKIRRYSTDVLIIGFGGAGLRAALEAGRSGAKVLLIGKGGFAEGGATGYAANEVAGFNVGDGIADPKDNEEEHYKDIMRAAQGVANPVLARILAEQAPSAYRELQSWGMSCLRSDGVPVVIQGCFASRPRMHMIPDHGKPILSALRSQLSKHGYAMLERHLVTDLVIGNGVCRGARALDPQEKPVLIAAKAVVLAAGGGGQLFSPNLYPLDITGDGYALAYRAGATLLNMEFMQAGLGILVPGQRPRLLNAWMWRMRPRIVDEGGGDVLSRHVPPRFDIERCYRSKTHFPFSTADDSRFIETAVKKASAAGRVFLDFARNPGQALGEAGLGALWRTTAGWYARRGVDLGGRPVEVVCVGHAVNGGVEIDEHGQTDIKGLFAAGESAGGPHGADRLGGNMLLAAQVFGKIAGRSAAEFARESQASGAPSIDQAVHGTDLPEGAGLKCELIQRLRSELQDVLSMKYLVVKDRSSLDRCESVIGSIGAAVKGRGAARTDPGASWALCELRNLLDASRSMVAAAKKREESRGGHFREDFPECGPDWRKVITCRSKGDEGEAILSRKSFACTGEGGAE